MSDHLARLHGWLKDTEAASIAVEDGNPGDGRIIEETTHPRSDEAQLIHPVGPRVQRSLPPSSSGGGQTKLFDQDGTPETKLGQTDSDHEDEHTYPHHEGKPACSAYDEPIYLDYEEQTYSDYEDEQTYSDSEEDSLKPGDSMSQIQQPDLSVPPALLKPTASQLSGLTAGGDQPAHYFSILANAGMEHTKYVQTSHRHLIDDFSVENLACVEPDVREAKAQEDLRRFGRSLGRDGGRSEADLNHEMYSIIRTYLDQESGDHEPKYAVGTPGTWNRIPAELSKCCDLSLPTVDLVIGVNPLNPTLITHSDSSLPHPLSSEAMIRILQNPATANKAPVKSTATHRDFYYTHDLCNFELKKLGKYKKDKTGTSVSSNEMRVAQAQTCNGNFVQLGCVAQFFLDVPLANDGPFRRFVLSMTICGPFWTVEYAYRANADLPDTSFATVAQGNWAQQPEIFLRAIKLVLEMNKPLLEDKALRMAKLLEEAVATATLVPVEQPIKIDPISFAVSPQKKAQSKAKREAERKAKSIADSSAPTDEMTVQLGNVKLHPPGNGLDRV